MHSFVRKVHRVSVGVGAGVGSIVVIVRRICVWILGYVVIGRLRLVGWLICIRGLVVVRSLCRIVISSMVS